jgi:hypothetical protein
MIHLQFYITYLKVSWVKQFFCNLNGDWQNILLLLTNLKDYGGVRTFLFRKENLLKFQAKLVTLSGKISSIVCTWQNHIP